MMLQRLCKPLKSRSFFLFGARATGKTTFISQQFSTGQQIYEIDLLDPDTEEEFARDPKRLERLDLDEDTWIFIDEVQKLPKLLDVCHRMITKKKAKFILSGSSSRKLKRGGANMLGGRAQLCSLHPMTHVELGDIFDLDVALKWGTLPEVYLSNDDQERRAILRAYTQIYLKEEIQLEQLVRNLDPFRLFLEICAQMNGKVINHSHIAREAGVDYKTVQAYFSILEETYIGFYLNPYHKSVRKKQLSHPKFYLFDLGVCYALLKNFDRSVNPRTAAYGMDFESFIINEIYRLNDYLQADFQLSYLATPEGLEIDLILSSSEFTYLLEIKSSDSVDAVKVARFDRQLSTLSIAGNTAAIWLSQDTEPQTIGNVKCLHWQQAIRKIFDIA